MISVTAIVLAAGKGVRSKLKIPKPLIRINNQPIIIQCLKVLANHPRIGEIIVVVNRMNKEAIIHKIKKYRIGKIKAVVLGGIRRQDSVKAGLKLINKDTKLVLIHDGVRPFINHKLISTLIEEANDCGAAILGVPVKATVKQVKIKADKVTVEETLSRDNLWEIQTPQVFRKELILKAYQQFGNIDVTDDSALVEKLGVKPAVVFGSYKNIKITTSEDLIFAKAIANLTK
ncbi:MAG: 2-C-methyl-D-erythritol 4-phosphate cytidylyltransferase [Candidatus Omnitrophica bacterium]|nr:2-C-methyl-D-erythritol 4-phosphate cytidylyltransferase [Candidatus Omnitrophota bacterium]